MKIKFDKYFRPETLDEALDLLDNYGSDAKILAGGTDLTVQLRSQDITPKVVIDVTLIPELKELSIGEDEAVIGANSKMRELALNADLIVSQWGILAECASKVSTIQVKNVATIGGNIGNASPSADTVQGLILLDAKVKVAKKGAERTVEIKEFFKGPGVSVLEPNEMIVSIILPQQAEKFGVAYIKSAPRDNADIAVVSTGCLLTLDANNKVSDVRISLGSVAPTPIRAFKTEEYLKGKEISAEVVEKAVEIVTDNVKPITDQRGSANYRKDLVGVNVKNVILEAEARIR